MPQELTHPVILILAAGASSRMRGRDKLLEQVAGEPLLVRQIRVARATGVPVLVALPPGDSPRRTLVVQARAGVVEVADCATGMAASIRAGVAMVPQTATGLLLMLADMPEIETTDLQRLLEAHAADAAVIVRAASTDGAPGHPILFPARLFAALRKVQGDQGARDLLVSAQVRLIPLPGNRALIDLDTPEEWQAWRERSGV